MVVGALYVIVAFLIVSRRSKKCAFFSLVISTPMTRIKNFDRSVVNAIIYFYRPVRKFY